MDEWWLGEDGDYRRELRWLAFAAWCMVGSIGTVGYLGGGSRPWSGMTQLCLGALWIAAWWQQRRGHPMGFSHGRLSLVLGCFCIVGGLGYLNP